MYVANQAILLLLQPSRASLTVACQVEKNPLREHLRLGIVHVLLHDVALNVEARTCVISLRNSIGFCFVGSNYFVEQIGSKFVFSDANL